MSSAGSWLAVMFHDKLLSPVREGVARLEDQIDATLERVLSHTEIVPAPAARNRNRRRSIADAGAGLGLSKAEQGELNWISLGGGALEPGMRSGAVALLDIAWLIELAKSGGVLSRRQELPPAAFVQLDGDETVVCPSNGTVACVRPAPRT